LRARDAAAVPSVRKNVAYAALQLRDELLQRVEREVLLRHFKALKRGCRYADPALELYERHVPARLAQVFGELLAEATTHALQDEE
jgi:hypothetical protein